MAVREKGGRREGGDEGRVVGIIAAASNDDTFSLLCLNVLSLSIPFSPRFFAAPFSASARAPVIRDGAKSPVAAAAAGDYKVLGLHCSGSEAVTGSTYSPMHITRRTLSMSLPAYRVFE